MKRSPIRFVIRSAKLPRSFRLTATRVALACCTSLLAATVSMTGCAKLARATPDPKVVTAENSPSVLISISDSSKSNRNNLPLEIQAEAEVLPRLPHDCFQLDYRVDSSLERLREGPVPASDEAYLSEVLPLLEPFSTRDNTYLQLAFTWAAKQAETCTGRVALLIQTDWFEEGMDARAHQELKEACIALANNPHVAIVVVVGVNPANSACMTEELGPLNSKVRPFNANSVDLDVIKEALAQ